MLQTIVPIVLNGTYRVKKSNVGPLFEILETAPVSANPIFG